MVYKTIFTQLHLQSKQNQARKTCSLFIYLLAIHYTRKLINYFMMSSTRRIWTVAASVGVVEALKDQGLCRWNYGLRLAQHHVKNHLRSLSQAKKLSSSNSYTTVSNRLKEEETRQSEESLRTVMYLSCWGPNN
ncbi:hypothetical protein RYX36_010559 [Vicia faba]